MRPLVLTFKTVHIQAIQGKCLSGTGWGEVYRVWPLDFSLNGSFLGDVLVTKERMSQVRTKLALEHFKSNRNSTD